MFSSNTCSFHNHLCAFVKDSNDFTKELAPYVDDPHQFWIQLNKVTEGTIKIDSESPLSTRWASTIVVIQSKGTATIVYLYSMGCYLC